MTMEPTKPDQPESEATAPAAEPPPAEPPLAQAPPVPVAAVAQPPAQPAPAWQAPVEPAGPFPGVKFADHGKRLVSYILDVIIAGALTIAFAVGFGILTAIFAAAGIDILALMSGVSLVISVFAVSLIYWPYFGSRAGRRRA